MENRNKIIEDITKKVIKLLDSTENLDLIQIKLSKKFFLKEEIEEYNKKIEIIKYLENGLNKKEFIEKNLDIIIFFIKDMREFLSNLKNKKIKLLEKVFNESVNSLENFEKFQKFLCNDKIYLSHYSHYFTEKEIEEYEKIWNELDEFLLVEIKDEKFKNEYWKINFERIKVKVLELILFINKIREDYVV